jgi:U3 small nucleolar RNA-associated protein 15
MITLLLQAPGSKYTVVSNTVKKIIARFGQMASSGRFRYDGRLLVAGGDEGVVRVFDLNNGMILRQFKGHSK